MKSIILVTGASSGIGRLSAQALAEAGHVVYATMRSVIDFVGDGATEVLEVSERVRIEFSHRIGISDLLQAKIST